MKDKEAVETTDMFTEKFRVYKPVVSGCEADRFNQLGHHPPRKLDLGDGRLLAITSWAPEADCREHSGLVHVIVKGFIVEQEEPASADTK